MLLKEGQKFLYLAEHSVYLTTRIHDKCRVKFYACNTFFVELFYDFSGSGIADMQVFKDLAKLEPYLSVIGIDEAFFFDF